MIDKFTEDVSTLMEELVVYDSTATEEAEETDDDQDAVSIAGKVAMDPKNPTAPAAKANQTNVSNTYATLMKGITTKTQSLIAKIK